MLLIQTQTSIAFRDEEAVDPERVKEVIAERLRDMGAEVVFSVVATRTVDVPDFKHVGPRRNAEVEEWRERALNELEATTR